MSHAAGHPGPFDDRLKPKQRGTLRALGLRRINHTVEHADRPEIRGMLAQVPHLVRVEEVAP